jgi:hypothetical protein
VAADPIETSEDIGYRQVYDWLMKGLPASTISRLFRMEVDTCRRKIRDLKPVGERNGYPLYSVAEAAEFLVQPRVDLEAYLKKLRPQDMPQGIQKSFWDAQNGRLKFMADAGHLWRTDRVQFVIADAFKVIRQRVLLFADTVDRQTGLTEEQRTIVQNMADGLLEDLHAAIIEHFKNLPAEMERDEIFEKGAPGATLNKSDDEDEWGGL